MRPREEGRGFFQELVLHPQTGDLAFHLAHPRPLHRTQRLLRLSVLTPPRIDPIAERAVMDPQASRDLRDRLPGLDHHLHGLGLELRTEPPTLFGHSLPFHGYAQNQIWLEIVALAADLLAWTQTLAFDQHAPVRRWEPKRLRLRLLAVAGRITRTGRQRRLRLPRGWPWNHLIDTSYAALRTA